MTKQFPWDGKAPRKNPAKENDMNNMVRKRLCEELPGCVCFKHHGTAFGVAGHTDLYGVYLGMPFFIEGKTGTKATEKQERFMQQMCEAGAAVGVYHNYHEARDLIVEGWHTWRKRFFSD